MTCRYIVEYPVRPGRQHISPVRVRGVRAVQIHLVCGVEGVYRSQGVLIHDEQIEVIVRQVLCQVTVVGHGDTGLLPREIVDCLKYNELSCFALTGSKKIASACHQVIGIS